MIRRKQRRTLMGIVCGALLCMASYLHAEPSLRVRGIKVTETKGDTAVRIQSSARPTFTTWKLEQPARVVVELSGARLGDVDVPLAMGTRAVSLISANVSEDPTAGPRTRIVLTLRQPSDYRVETEGNEILLKVIPHVRLDDVVETALPIAKKSSSSVNEVQARQEREKAIADAEVAQKIEAQVREARGTKAEADRLILEAARSKKEADIQTRVALKTKAEAEVQVREAIATKNAVLAKMQEENQRRAEEQERQRARVREAILNETKAQRLAQEKADMAAQKESQVKLETERLKLALLEAQKEAEKARSAAATAKDEFAKQKADMAARKESQVKLETERLKLALLEAQKEAEKARSTAATAKDEFVKQKADMAARKESQGKLETERLKLALLEAQKEAENARFAAATAKEENAKQQALRIRTEAALKVAQLEMESARRRAEKAEDEAERIHKRESSQGETLKLAANEVEHRKKILDQMVKAQDDQRIQLTHAERMVTERESALAARTADLAKREKEAQVARSKRDALAKDSSERIRLQAMALVAKAEAQQDEAQAALLRSRLELEKAVESRKEEEARRVAQIQLRKEEERRLAEAISLRKEEETRLGGIKEERFRLEAERAKFIAERAELERSKTALVIEVGQLAQKREAAVASAKAPTMAKLATPKEVAPAPGRSRSITLRARSQIRNIEFIDEPNRSSVIIDVDDLTEFKIERLRDRQISLRLMHTDLPLELERNLDATEYLGPVKVVSSYRDPKLRGTVHVVVDLAEEVPNRIRKDGRRLFWDFQKTAGAASPSLPAYWSPTPMTRFLPAQKVAGVFTLVSEAAWQGQVVAAPPAAPAGATARPALVGKKRYIGRRIDLDFKGADIHNILRLLADVGGVNIVVADEVKGDVTIKMRDVPWDQALDVVLRAKGLGAIREGNLLRVAPLVVLEKELEAEIARQKQIADVLPTETRLIGVSYAEAGTLVEKARDLLSPRGKISYDTRTNNIIVSDVVKNLQLVEDLVRNLDTQTSQVVIEARIVEANSNFTRQIGIQWGGSGFADATHGNPTGLVFPYNIGIGGGADDSSSPVSGLVPSARSGTGTSSSPNFLVNMPAPAGLGTGAAIGLTMGSVAGAFNLNLRLSALESQGQVRILSSPRITTMDNVEASIEQGVSIPIAVVSAAGAQTQFVDAKLHLGVKPHVTNEGTIALVVSITRNEPDFVNTGARGDPSIQKKEAKTSMLVRDGDTAVIGGIYTRNTGMSNAKVPFFSDIPVLGWFFRNRKENDNRSEFLVFITPRIVNRARVLGQ
jgi:type IV pilus assembly protein PilQ